MSRRDRAYTNLTTVMVGLALLIGMPQYAHSEFLKVRIAHFDSRETLQKSEVSRKSDTSNGLSVSQVSVDVDPNVRGFAPLMKSDGTFKLNDFVVVCFTPSQNMVVRMVDTNPNGRTQRIFPLEKSSAPVIAGKEYCLGGPKSESTLRMGEKSGQGFGVLQLIGAPSEANLPAVDAAPLPRIDVTPNGTSSSGDVFEAWLKYTVQ